MTLLKFKNKKILSLGIIKIAIIILASIFLIGTFYPFYFGSDSHLYGMGAVNIVNGSYEYTNEFLDNPELFYEKNEIFIGQSTGFFFGPWIETIHGTLILNGNFGIYVLSAFSYLLGGYYGLFYLGPIITILFLIISERVVTKLFGGFVGLVALIFLSTDAIILNWGRQLLTDSIFGLLLILGCFFLIKFLKEKNNISILLCSGFLAAATFFRLNGVIYLPIEILIIASYFLFQYIKIRKEDVDVKSSSNLNFLKLLSKIEIKKILKTSLYILGPWAIFFLFLFSYNSYFFDDPFTTYLEQYAKRANLETENIISSNLVFDSDRFESIKSYSTELTPDQAHFLIRIVSFDSVLLDQFLLSVISFSLLISALVISLYFKINRKEIIIFIIFILGLLLFYSSGPVVSRTGITHRYMIAALPMSFAIVGYLMYRAWQINFQKISLKNFLTVSKFWKIFLVIIIAIFLFSSLYYSKSVESLFIKQSFKFKNPQVFADRYPLDQEGLTEKSIILHGKGRALIWEYDAIPFNPFQGYVEKDDNWLKKSETRSFKTINALLNDGYDLYVFKEKDLGDPSYYKNLESKHNLILKEHSETFCKLIKMQNASTVNNIQIKSDDICHTFSKK